MPVVTECALYNDQHELLALGYAVCSAWDQCQKAIGRNIAKERAHYALEMEDSVALPISRIKVLRKLTSLSQELPAWKAIKVQQND
jgi:hypothetical protein